MTKNTGGKPEPIKLCWWCKHFCYSAGSPHYSDLTPGSDLTMECLKNIWQFDSCETSQEEFGNMMQTATDCKYFKQIKK